jgi:hypothetical protein
MDVPEHSSELSPALIQAYRSARYEIAATPAFTMQVDRPSPRLAELLRGADAAGALFITAWNPCGRELSREENDLRHARLVLDMKARGLTAIDAFGAHGDDPTQGEVSLLVLGVGRPAACEFGNLHDQNAVLWAAPQDATPRLLLLR